MKLYYNSDLLSSFSKNKYYGYLYLEIDGNFYQMENETKLLRKNTSSGSLIEVPDIEFINRFPDGWYRPIATRIILRHFLWEDLEC